MCAQTYPTYKIIASIPLSHTYKLNKPWFWDWCSSGLMIILRRAMGSCRLWVFSADCSNTSCRSVSPKATQLSDHFTFATQPTREQYIPDHCVYTPSFTWLQAMLLKSVQHQAQKTKLYKTQSNNNIHIKEHDIQSYYSNIYKLFFDNL